MHHKTILLLVIKQQKYKKGVSQVVTILDYVPTIQFHLYDDKLWISFDLDGSFISEKYYDLEQRLNNLLNMRMSDKIIQDGFIMYMFPTEVNKRLIIDKNTNFKLLFNNQQIRITEKLAFNFRKTPHG